MNYIKIDNCNMNNGDGLRCVVWLSGCEHRCEGCFNPETWDITVGSPWNDEAEQVVCDTLSQDWCSGLTLTGGDPMHPENIAGVLNLCRRMKKKFPRKNIWVYTGNIVNPDDELYKDIDVIVDGPYIDSLKSLDAHWVGSSNQKVIHLKH